MRETPSCARSSVVVSYKKERSSLGFGTLRTRPRSVSVRSVCDEFTPRIKSISLRVSGPRYSTAESASNPALPMSRLYSSLRIFSISAEFCASMRSSTSIPSSTSATPAFLSASVFRPLSIASWLTPSIFCNSVRLRGLPSANNSASICPSVLVAILGGRNRIRLQGNIPVVRLLSGFNYTLLHQLQQRQKSDDYFAALFFTREFSEAHFKSFRYPRGHGVYHLLERNDFFDLDLRQNKRRGETVYQRLGCASQCESGYRRVRNIQRLKVARRTLVQLGKV